MVVGIDPDAASVIPYEELLNKDNRRAVTEGSLFFQQTGEVQKSLRRFTKQMKELGIPYALVGGLAMFQHGYRRYTEDVDILVTRDGLQRIHARLIGASYVRPLSESVDLRDAASGVKIDFLIAGQFPGDGKPKPVAFPDPSDSVIELNDMCVVKLPTLWN